MIVIYDWDGTLTPYSAVRLAVYDKCHWSEEKFMEIMKSIMDQEHLDLYSAYYKTIEKAFESAQIPMTISNLTENIQNLELNPGVVDYFEHFATPENGFHNFIVSSNYVEFLKRTVVASYFEEIHAGEYNMDGELFTTMKYMLNDQKKPEVIRKILETHPNDRPVLYLGDGMTDRYAFEYVHSIGGKSIFVYQTEEDLVNYKKLEQLGFMDGCYQKDYRPDSPLRRYLSQFISKE